MVAMKKQPSQKTIFIIVRKSSQWEKLPKRPPKLTNDSVKAFLTFLSPLSNGILSSLIDTLREYIYPFSPYKKYPVIFYPQCATHMPLLIILLEKWHLSMSHRARALYRLTGHSSVSFGIHKRKLGSHLKGARSMWLSICPL